MTEIDLKRCDCSDSMFESVEFWHGKGTCMELADCYVIVDFKRVYYCVDCIQVSEHVFNLDGTERT